MFLILPAINELQLYHIIQMCIVCNREVKERDVDGHLEIVCSGCPNIKIISNLSSTSVLTCRNCPNLETIDIQSCLELWCDSCPKLKSIRINRINVINSDDCPY